MSCMKIANLICVSLLIVCICKMNCVCSIWMMMIVMAHMYAYSMGYVYIQNRALRIWNAYTDAYNGVVMRMRCNSSEVYLNIYQRAICLPCRYYTSLLNWKCTCNEFRTKSILFVQYVCVRVRFAFANIVTNVVGCFNMNLRRYYYCI